MKSEKQLVSDVLEILNNDTNVISGTIVGSILDKTFSEISDVDVIVVVNNITKLNIDHLKKQILNLNPLKYGEDRKFEINDTFGPLKMDGESKLIFHLMIYSKEMHIQHVIKSPFTCYDWERSDHFVKMRLSEIYPTRKLMFSDFSNSRRGIFDYVSDLKNKKISYREYEFKNEQPEEVEKFFDLDEKHTMEFSYHILKNLINNFLKTIESENIKFNEQDFLVKWKYFMPDLYEQYSELYIDLSLSKKDKKKLEKKYIANVMKFLESFYQEIEKKYQYSQKINLVRHFPTPLNNGTFLGQKSNPGIIKNFELSNNLVEIAKNSSLVISSPLKRCLDTLEVLNLKNFKTDSRLLEFDYGLAEGLSFGALLENFPTIETKIQLKQDFNFPQGENYSDIFRRVNNLIQDNSDDRLLLISHQGPIRAILGSALGINVYDWYKIDIPFGIPLEFVIHNDKILVNIERVLLSQILKNLDGNEVS
tara:strand:+ start:1776 stop:3209 length:1434 start_codon:yes stop_codon:yes gene_type:complete